MTTSAVVSRYASALADVVTAPTSPLSPAAAVAELRAFESALLSSSELHNALVTPAVAGSRKKAVVGRIADVLKLSRIPRNFLFILVDRRRIDSLSAIIKSFEVIVDERLGYAQAEVTSAREMTAEQQAAVTGQLEKLTGKRIRAKYGVNEALIGGVVARIGSTVYNGSVRNELDSLQRRMSAES